LDKKVLLGTELTTDDRIDAAGYRRIFELYFTHDFGEDDILTAGKKNGAREYEKNY